jgi:UDP-N-acetylmuramoyl-L-alanyl-D-glutamate--2,6-diaminopimelate ligase
MWTTRNTPDALVNALRTLRLLRPRRIITVFGCGGDRDRTKRPAMARAVQEGSDVCIVTTDNPRFEDPAQIFADIVKGFSRKNYVEIPNRAEAIKSAITNAQPGDIVLIAGKGHETYQDIKGVKHDFDDTPRGSRSTDEPPHSTRRETHEPHPGRAGRAAGSRVRAARIQ